MSQHTPAIQRPRRCPRSGVRALGRLKTRIARERALHCVCRTNMDPFTTLRRSERAQLENVVKTQSNNRGFFPRLGLENVLIDAPASIANGHRDERDYRLVLPR